MHVEMVDKLLRGHGQFHGDSTEEERAFLGRLASEGQSPGALFVGCSDSRVVPEILTASSPGELFVVRNVANVVPPYGHASVGVGAALEYAVAVLEVPHVIVCGHYGCGGVEAAFGGLESVKHLPSLCDWLDDVFPVMDRVRADVADEPHLTSAEVLRRAVEHNTISQVAHLSSYPVVRDALEAGKLHLHAWIYDLHSLRLSVLDVEAARFVPATAILPI
jgi:carbonic anhydrase